MEGACVCRPAMAHAGGASVTDLRWDLHHGATVTSRGRVPKRLKPISQRIDSAVCQRATALIERTEGLVGRYCPTERVIVPGFLRLFGRLHFEEIHVVDHAAVSPDPSLAEQRIIGRHV